MRMHRCRGSQNRRGVVAVLVAVSMIVVFGVAALAVDAGRLYRERRNAQAAADAAAEAAGLELYSHYKQYQGQDCDGSARSSALEVAANNGYSASHVTVNIPPSSGPYAAQDGFAEVIISSPTARAFSVIYGRSDLVLQARAVAAGTITASKASVIVLDPKRKDPLKLKGKNSELEVAGDVIVNSTNKRAVKVDKRAQLVADNLLVAGGIDKNSKGLIDASVSTGLEPTPDPMASLPKPAKGTSQAIKDYKSNKGSQDVYDLQPGNYKELKFDSDDVINLAPGVYFVDGEILFKGSCSISGSGVMLYTNGKKGVKFHTSGEVTLSPPTKGTYEGITLFQDSGSKSKMEFKNDHDLNMSGIIYAANSEVKFKNTDVEMDEDWESESDEYTLENDGNVSYRSSLGASIICRKLTIEKGSHVQLRGADIDAKKPILGLVE